MPGKRKFPDGMIGVVFVPPWDSKSECHVCDAVHQKYKVLQMARTLKPHKNAMELANWYKKSGKTICTEEHHPRFLPDGTSLNAEFGACHKRKRVKGPRMVMTSTGPMRGHMFHIKHVENTSGSVRAGHVTKKLWVCSLCKLTINKSDHVRAALERPCFPCIAGDKKRRERLNERHKRALQNKAVQPPKRLTCAGEGTGSRRKRPRRELAWGTTSRPPE